jgi:hypothetical protein
MAGKPTPLPVNGAPYALMQFRDIRSGRQRRCRITGDLSGLPFEKAHPVRKFPAYRGKRSHEGSYWFAASGSHVRFESYFESIALMLLDFSHSAAAVSSNPFWLLWPRGSQPPRHVPDFFARLNDGSILVVDVHPADRMSPSVAVQHERTRAICSDLGWRYCEVTAISSTLQHDVAILRACAHSRFAPTPVVRDTILGLADEAKHDAITVGQVVTRTVANTGAQRVAVLSSVYHLMWQRCVHADLARPLTLDSQVWR